MAYYHTSLNLLDYTWKNTRSSAGSLHTHVLTPRLLILLERLNNVLSVRRPADNRALSLSNAGPYSVGFRKAHSTKIPCNSSCGSVCRPPIVFVLVGGAGIVCMPEMCFSEGTAITASTTLLTAALVAPSRRL